MASNFACPVGGERGLTAGEVALVRSTFGDAIALEDVRIRRRKWAFFQPSGVVMAPCGHIHFHPKSNTYCEDFSLTNHSDQGLFIHEMTHVWQAQKYGAWYLPLCRTFSRRYDYSLKPGWPLHRYGIEQQAEIVRHAFLLRNGVKLAGVEGKKAYDQLVNFTSAR